MPGRLRHGEVGCMVWGVSCSANCDRVFHCLELIGCPVVLPCFTKPSRAFDGDSSRPLSEACRWRLQVVGAHSRSVGRGDITGRTKGAAPGPAAVQWEHLQVAVGVCRARADRAAGRCVLDAGWGLASLSSNESTAGNFRPRGVFHPPSRTSACAAANELGLGRAAIDRSSKTRIELDWPPGKRGTSLKGIRAAGRRAIDHQAGKTISRSGRWSRDLRPGRSILHDLLELLRW